MYPSGMTRSSDGTSSLSVSSINCWNWRLLVFRLVLVLPTATTEGQSNTGTMLFFVVVWDSMYSTFWRKTSSATDQPPQSHEQRMDFCSE